MTIPRTMRAAVLTAHGGLDTLEVRGDWPTPKPAGDEALIRVAACGVNNTDINTRLGWYARDDGDKSAGAWGGRAVQFPRIQGADVAGVVVAVGGDANAGLVGKRVLADPWLRDWDNAPQTAWGYFGSECDGGFAEYAKISARNLHPIKSDLRDAELATFATSSVTAENMLTRAKVREGELVFITGASGGVGTALIQLAKRRGARVAAMAKSEKFPAVKAAGADAVIPRDTPDLAAALRDATGDESADVVADVVGGDRWPQFIRLLKRGGRYTCAGAIAGAKVAFDLRDFYLNDLTFTGATIPPPDTFANIAAYIARGELRPLLAATFPLSDIKAAQKAFLAKNHTGNLAVMI